MGLSLFSSSTYDERSQPVSTAVAYPKATKDTHSKLRYSPTSAKGQYVGAALVTPPNPNPKKYVIERSIRIGWYLVIEITYPNCTNYEGKKCMVYKNIDVRDLVEQGSIDPHFCDNKDFHSPIARFEPTERGWKMALMFAKKMEDEDLKGNW